jgi:positive regulator of sigma E activity
MTGQVHAIDETGVIIAEKNSACFGCMNQKCGAKPRFFTVENGLNLPLHVGQLVETGVPKRVVALQALVALFPPLAGFIALFALTGALFPALNESALAASGICGLFLAAFITYCFRKRFPSKKNPHILRTL